MSGNPDTPGRGPAVVTGVVAVEAAAVPPRALVSNYPEPFTARVAGRQKRVLGGLFGLRNFGVNLTRLAPGAASSVHHRHGRQDEFVYVVEGEPVLVTGADASQPGVGEAASPDYPMFRSGFRAACAASDRRWWAVLPATAGRCSLRPA